VLSVFHLITSFSGKHYTKDIETGGAIPPEKSIYTL